VDDVSALAEVVNLESYTIDMQLADPTVLSDRDTLVAIMRAAAERGQAVVLGECAHVFPNGAVTAVLLLSQSHLSVHTWPEYSVANFDLLTCGPLSGELIVASLEAALRPATMTVSRTVRDILG
jgi:S-adenosylmethionine decarboxylase